jgi:hypothetical protein
MRKFMLFAASTAFFASGFASAHAQSILQGDVFTQRQMATQFGMFSGAPWGSPLDLEGRAAYVAKQRGAPTGPDAADGPANTVIVHTGR